MRFIASAILLLLCSAAAGQEIDLGTDAQREAGRALYMDKCSHCHGDAGDGNGPAKEVFRPQPRDFTAATFKFRTTASGELPTDADIIRSIRDGMPYTGMPAWPSLSDAQVRNLMYFIKTLASDFSGPFAEVTPIEVPEPVGLSEESVARGREVYIENQCFDCHGMQGRGDGPSAPTLKDQWDIPIRPADLTKRWTFRRGTTREDIYVTFVTGLDGSPMPSYEIDPPEDAWHLVNYVHSLSRDEPDYATTVVAKPVGEASAETLTRDSFDAAPAARFPVVGQVIEPGRAFYPGVNAIEIRAVYSESDIAFLLSWHDMVADRTGQAGPDLPTPRAGEDVDTTLTFADAVALQFPTEVSEGTVKPYLMFGDRDNSADIWFVELASAGARHFVGRGRGDLVEGGPSLEATAGYSDGEWTVILSRSRSAEGSASFAEGEFVPVVASVWDGFNRERGNRRGLTSWYHVFLEPAESESAVLPALTYGFGTLLLGVGLTLFVRRRHRSEEAEA